MKKKQFKMTRRQVLKAGMMGGVGLMLPWRLIPKAQAAGLVPKLSDPATQPKFVNLVPNVPDSGFKYFKAGEEFTVGVGPNNTHETGLVDKSGARLPTPIWGYGQGTYTWPGMTFEVQRDESETIVNWINNLDPSVVINHLLPVDTSLHWCYSLHGYENYTIDAEDPDGKDIAGVPIITHVHGGHTDFQFDGNPEFFYNWDESVVGPQWDDPATGGFTTQFRYDNDVPAGNLWYHDHALGLTRLNVYAGLAGFYFVRDQYDTGGLGDQTNDLGLPKGDYELAYAIQDRMFKKGGKLFYPAFPRDPAWADFITGEGLKNGDVPKPSALAEFFGDHMVVNGLIWPKADVEPSSYRIHLLNGCDSRFMGLRFRAVDAGDDDFTNAGDPIDFRVIGSDQGLANSATTTNLLLFEPGSRYDIIFDFQTFQGQRIIMENVGGDAPFGGDLFPDLTPSEIEEAVDAGDLFPNRQTDRIMAFDVSNASDSLSFDDIDVFDDFGPKVGDPTPGVPIRKVALFEGKDEFGRLQPLLGTVDEDNLNEWESQATPWTWSQTTTETPTDGTTEEWWIYNFTGDAHPVHLHLVNFEILGRRALDFDDSTGMQPVTMHNGTTGIAPVITEIEVGDDITDTTPDNGYVENAPKDMVTALPEQVTRIKATFDKTGRYVWHCHILSHEDHEMMRVLQVVPS